MVLVRSSQYDSKDKHLCQEDYRLLKRKKNSIEIQATYKGIKDKIIYEEK